MGLISRVFFAHTSGIKKVLLNVIILFLSLQSTELKAVQNESAPKLAWKFTVPAFVTEMEVATETGNIAATSIYDLEKAQGDNRLYYFNKFGRKIWDYLLPAQTRTLEVSADGEILLLSLRNDTVVAISGTGKKLWERKGTCRAYPLQVSKNQFGALCFYDDDTESVNSVEWIGPSGETKKQFSYGKVSPDGLGFVINPDWKSFLLWFPNGKVIWQSLIEPFTVQEYQVSGAIVRAQFHPDGKLVEALFLDHVGKNRHWAQWDFKSKKPILSLPVTQSVAQWKWINNTLYMYGNASAGQVLIYAKSPTKKNAKWITDSDSKPGNYHALLQTDSDNKILITAWQREIRALDSSAKVSWSIEETRDEGNFLFHFFHDRTGPNQMAKQLILLGEENQIKSYSIP